jgi:arsenical pump membrane protein
VSGPSPDPRTWDTGEPESALSPAPLAVAGDTQAATAREDATSDCAPSSVPGRFGWSVAGVGLVAAGAGAALDPSAAGHAAAQVWSPFVLVAGLLLVGMVAAQDGVFAAAGARLDSLAPSPLTLYLGSMALVAVVTAVLNLDTSVTFLTPVLVEAGRRRRQTSGEGPELPLLYGCLLMSNAASLLLPGSNLTNLIVLGHLHLSGGQFAARMAPAWVAAVVVTGAAVALAHRRTFGSGRRRPSATPRRPAVSTAGTGADEAEGATTGGAKVLGLAGVAAATVLVVVLRAPALAVLGVGVTVYLLRQAHHPSDAARWRATWRSLGVPVLAGLFGIAVGAGTLGRAWSGPQWLLAHAGAGLGSALSAALSVAVNNLPAASLLAARHPAHPFSVLVGLDLGPNLAVTGSLSALLWWQAARQAGARPSARHVSRLGVLSVPVAMAAALAVLAATGSH